jgi:hypothetical protein
MPAQLIFAILTAGLLLAPACTRRSADAPELPLAQLRVWLTSEPELRKLVPPGEEVVQRPWVGSIIQVLIEEAPEPPRPVPRQRIAGSGVTVDALFDRAFANLRAASPRPLAERTVRMAKANVQITRCADDHTAARLLLPELWSKIAADGGGRLFATAPVRDLVAWTTSTAEEDQRALRAQARTAFQSRSFPISTAILRWTGGGWALEDANPLPAP